MLLRALCKWTGARQFRAPAGTGGARVRGGSNHDRHDVPTASEGTSNDLAVPPVSTTDPGFIAISRAKEWSG